MTTRTLGVEEELMLVDPDTGMLTAVADRALRAHDDQNRGSAHLGGPGETPVEPELFRQQIETQTPPCKTMDELAAGLRRARRATCEVAASAGAAAVAMATPVLIDQDAAVTNKPRYQRILDEYGALARESLVCALHVHVEIAHAEEGVRALDGIGPWLPVLSALSANSPYAHGRDTGHASYRNLVWTRWPSHGTGQAFGDVRTYRAVCDRLVEWGAALDDGMLYFDARLSGRYPTIEIRVADVTAELEDAVLVAALCRALVSTYADAAPPGPYPGAWRSELVRAAGWRAARYGIADRLVDPATLELVPARDAIESLVDTVRPALAEADDLTLVRDLVERLLARGNGAIRQRRTFESRGTLEAVVEDLRRRTEESWREHGSWLAG